MDREKKEQKKGRARQPPKNEEENQTERSAKRETVTQTPKTEDMNQAEGPAVRVTQKHRDFVSQPMGKKKVKTIPGISGSFGERLISNKFNYAFQVLGHYLVLGMSEIEFKKWLKEKCDAGTRDQNACYEAMKEWCEHNNFP